MSQPINCTSTDETVTLPGSSHPSWKKELANATTSVPALLSRLHLDRYIDSTEQNTSFKCLVTDSYISKIKPGDINDPLLQQVLPLSQEADPLLQIKGQSDPVGDLQAQPAQGLLHKYHGRVLMISTGACAIHCRYCFRRAYPYQNSSFNNKALLSVLSYLNEHKEIEELILSGGDPLVLDNSKLAQLIGKLEHVDHIKTLRIHTRMPAVLPSRIDEGLLQLLKNSRFQVVMVIHTNHANELQQTELDALLRLHDSGITLLNQSVLLKGINDNADALIELSKRLFAGKTLPYYLHQLDPVSGAMHFKVAVKDALQLKNSMEMNLPGYLVPRLVQEIAGNKAKTAIFCI